MTNPWIERAQKLRNPLAEAAASGEIDRRLPDRAVALLHDAGMFRLSVPRALDGHEVDLGVQVRVLEALAQADAAAAWCVMIASTTALVAGYMAEDAAREVFGDPNRRACGVYAPKGKATAVDGGYRVKGQWPFGSGSHHSHFRLGGSLVFADGAKPQMRLMIFSAEQTEMLDTWNTSGLRGTGSHDFRVEDAFVPERFAVSLARVQRDEPLYRVPFFGFLAVEVAAVSLGLGRAALDAFRELAIAKVPTGSRRTVAQKGGAQVEYATAEARLRAARAFLLEGVGALEDALRAGDEPSVETKAALRLAAIHAARESADVTTAALRLGGGSAIYAGSPLQRLFRDANSVTAHAMVSPLMLEYLGKVMLGQTDDASML